MTVDDEPEQGEQVQDPAPPAPATEPPVRRAPRGPGSNTEQGLGLEVARLFGMDPRLLVAKRPRPAPRSTDDDPEHTDQTPDD
ncbi:MAG: hypothetical protein ACRDKW_02195 [Actinomycetota bacterium]